jgi:hypothetical protein
MILIGPSAEILIVPQSILCIQFFTTMGRGFRVQFRVKKENLNVEYNGKVLIQGPPVQRGHRGPTQGSQL